MIRGLVSDDAQGSCTAVPFAVEKWFEMPLVGEDVMAMLEVIDGGVSFKVGIEEQGSFQ